jgi:diguanylate cyclase (GGDEF)-like protein
MPFEDRANLPTAVLDVLPNPVLVKGADLRYVWVNSAFETLFNVKRADLIGELDVDVFKDRQAVACNSGDLRVLENGEIDNAYETVYRHGTEPRVTITRKIRLTDGDDSFLVGVMHDVTEVTEANAAVEASTALLEQQSEQLKGMAYTDPLTGVMTRRRLAETAPLVFQTHRNLGSVVVCDLDFFNKINDSFGHDAGDSALNHFVFIAQAALRDGDLLARTGGEEFAILLPSADTTDSFEIAERIRKTLEKSPLHYQENAIDMTVSTGLTQIDGGEFDLDWLLSAADKCLYRAKDEGRNRVVLAA